MTMRGRERETNLGKVATGVLSLWEIHFGSLLGPQVRFRIRLGQDTGRSDEVPSRECETCRRMVLLSRNVYRVERGAGRVSDGARSAAGVQKLTVVVDTERSVLRTSHLAVLVTFSEFVR